MKLTLGDACNPVISRIPASIGSNGTVSDKRLVAFINEAIQRLLFEGRWWGTYQAFNICATGGCITLPPQIATIETAAVCGIPQKIHDLWFEFLDNGIGLRKFYASTCGSNGSCGQGGTGFSEANYKGQYPVFSDIIPGGKKLLFVCDVLADVGTTITAYGYDDNGNWIRTQQNGVWADGEVISLAQSTGTKSVNNFATITDVQLPGLNGQVWLYEYNTTATTQRLIANYMYWESRPSYARYFFPRVQALINASGCTNGNTGCSSIGVDCIGKLGYVPAVNATDYLIIGNLPALKEMVLALNRAENEMDNVKSNKIIAAGLTTAKHLLDQELDSYLGAGRRIGINLQGSGNLDGENVHNFI